MCRGIAGIDQEIAVLFRNLGAADHKAPASGRIDFLPGLAARRIGKGAAAGAHAAWLRIATAGDDFLHARLDGGFLAGARLQFGMGEDPVGRGICMAIGHAHLRRGRADGLPLPVKAVGADGDVAEFAAIGAGIHPQAAADRSRNADQEFQPGQAVARGISRDVGIGGTGSGGDNLAFVADGGHMRAKPDDDARNAAVTHQQVGSGADGQHRYLCRAGGEEGAEIGGISRAENDIRRAADTEPGVARHRHGLAIVAANGGKTFDQRAGHDPASRNASISSGRRAAQPVMSPAPRHITRSPSLVREMISAASASGPCSAAGPLCPRSRNPFTRSSRLTPGIGVSPAA